jgi:hypothetical protein
MKTTLIALFAVLTLGVETSVLAEEETQPAATEESAPADSTNAMPDTPEDPPAAVEQGSSTDAMPAPSESESK